MRAFVSSSIFLALAISIGVYLYLTLSDEDVTSLPPEASVAPATAVPVAPVAEAAQTHIDDDLVDYLAARHIGSLEGWRAFLTAHGSGPHAQLARDELEKLLHAEKTPAPAIAEAPHGASPDEQATSEAARPAANPAGTEVAPQMLGEICRRDEGRLERLRSNPTSEEAARFANELRCEKLRPQLLGLMVSLSSSTPAPAAAGVSNGASPDAKAPSEVALLAAPSPATEAARSTPDESCKRDEERLERLRNSPSSEEAARFAKELACEKLRSQLMGLMVSLGSSTPAPAAAEVSNGASPDAKAPSEVARLAAPSPATEVAPSTPDESCKRDEERLERLRNSPSSEEASRFAGELRCETLRPQLLRLLESLGFAASTSASASQSPSVKGRSAMGLKAASDCASEQDSLNRIRAQPSADTAQQFWRDLQCERLRPQVRLLLESLNLAADPPGACRREAEELNRIRANPNRREAEGFVRDMTCDALKPQAARLLESLIE